MPLLLLTRELQVTADSLVRMDFLVLRWVKKTQTFLSTSSHKYHSWCLYKSYSKTFEC